MSTEETTMFSHVVIGTNDLQQSKRFYDKLLAALGYGPALPREAGGYVYVGGDALLIITQPRDGRSATQANGATIGFACLSMEDVENWHAAGMDGGGLSVEDPPGVRDTQFGRFYAAYLRDPDGNKLCALHKM
jgi:catechol 2,3-dioxygenase-like lactoylglutathione lyase family enzyme